MKIIKMKYVDFWPNFDVSKDLLYQILLSNPKYKVEFSESPDYIIYSTFGHTHLFYNCIKIFYAGEQQSPDFNICDYAISFEYINFMDRHFRLPLMYQPLYRTDYEQMLKRNQNFITTKNEFCAFVYSNPESDPFRGEFFEELSKYKKINSGGRYKNNIGVPVINKIDFERKHKFSIAFENVSYPGYMTEKLMQSFAAGGIPIYWGDPTIGETFNSKAFINVMDYPSIESVIAYIKYLDQNNDAYNSVIKESPLKKEKCLLNIESEFRIFVEHIFDQPVNIAERTTRKFWNYRYQKMERNKEQLYQAITPIRKIRARMKKYLKNNYEGMN